MLITGQIFSEEIIERIGETVCNTVDLSRCALSRLVCEWLNWKNAAGQLKEFCTGAIDRDPNT